MYCAYVRSISMYVLCTPSKRSLTKKNNIEWACEALRKRCRASSAYGLSKAPTSPVLGDLRET